MRFQYIPNRFEIYSLPSNFLDPRIGFGLLVFALVLGTSGYMILEDFSFSEAFYMAVITMSTVGYGEVQPLSLAGRWFNAGYILLNIGVFAYFIGVFGYYVIQGEIFKSMHQNLINSQIDKLKDHVILCGFGRYGREIAAQFDRHGKPFVVIDNNPEEIEHIRKTQNRILYLEEDATQDDVLVRAGIKRAVALVSALPEDSDNLFTVLTARQLNHGIEIISRATMARSVPKLRLAGANHVVMPEQIGGFYIANLVSKPEAVEFFSFLTSKSRSDFGFEEINYEDVPDHFRDKSIQDLHIRRDTGSNIIGFKTAKGEYIVNPAPSTVLEKGTSFILLGDKDQLIRLREMLVHKKESG